MKHSRVLFPLGLAAGLSLLGDLTLYAVLPTHRQTVGLSLGAVGVMLGVNRLVRIPGNPVAGFILDRVGRRKIFILGMSLGVLSTLGYGLLHGFAPFLLARIVWGVGWTLINVGGMTIVLDVSTPANRGRLTGFYNAWVLAGFALGPLLGGFLVDALGFRATMLSYAVATASGLLIALVGLPETAPQLVAGVRQGRNAASSPLRRLADLWQNSRGLLRSTPGLAPVLLLYLLTQFANLGVMLSTVNLLLEQCCGPTISVGAFALGVASASGILLAARSLLAGVVGPVAGRLSDVRWGRRAVIAGGLVVGAAAFGLLAIANSLWASVLGLALGAASSGTVMSVLTAHVGDLTPPGKQGAMMGIYATAGDIGAAAGPFLAFALLPVIDLQGVYLLCTLACLGGLLLLRCTE